ncbi:MAG: hypothetical protein ACRDBG_04620 [Waterburya sp.]
MFEYLVSNYLNPKELGLEEELGKELLEGLNWHYKQYYPDITLVKNFIPYDYAQSNDLTIYPLLKIFRTSEVYSGRNERQVKATISYAIAYADLVKLPYVLPFASATILKIIRAWNSREEQCLDIIGETITAEYRNFVTEANNAVYAYLRIPITFTERI